MVEQTAIPLCGHAFTAPESVVICSPYNGRVLGSVPVCGVDEVASAVRYAKRGLQEVPLPIWQRAQILDAVAVRLEASKEIFARTIAQEAAKPIKTARAEVDRAVGTFKFAAAEARTLSSDVLPMDAIESGVGKIGFFIREPIGVVGAIAPFNFPLNLVAHKVAPAIAAGCPVVLKPASQTPFSSILLAELIHECGLPAEYLQIVTGSGTVVGNALVEDPGVALITFTGSPSVGWSIRARAPQKRVGLELGNNAPLIIEADSDWKTAAAKIKTAGFSHAGQSCISTQRVYIQEEIYDEFCTELIGHVASLKPGDPLDETTDISSLISIAERDRVVSWINQAVDSGATILTGGSITHDGILLPTVLADTEPDMNVNSEEVFGPVVTVTSYQVFEQAIELANSTKFGLQAGIFTSNIAKALRAIHELDFGGVLINEVPTWRADHQPYGGKRDSGNTREGPAFSIQEMTEIKMVVLGG